MAVNEKIRNKTVGVSYDEDCLLHEGGQDHPERPDRLAATLNRLRRTHLLEEMHRSLSREATDEELVRCHDIKHIRQIDNFVHHWDTSAPQEENFIVTKKTTPEKYICPFGIDTYFTKDTPRVARLAAGNTLSLLDDIYNPECPTRSGFALVRPPGHHASRSKAQGFCIYNNVALAAQHARVKYGAKKVLILDWDVHHGNGTQDIFLHQSHTVVVSIHRHSKDFFPGTGDSLEVGNSGGKGATLNVPLPRGYTDVDVFAAFRSSIIPAIIASAPDLIIVSAGFDAAENDPLGGCCMTRPMFAWLTKQVHALAEFLCNGRLLLVLEGGYEPESVAECVEHCVNALLEGPEKIPNVNHTLLAPPLEILARSAAGAAQIALNWQCQKLPKNKTSECKELKPEEIVNEPESEELAQLCDFQYLIANPQRIAEAFAIGGVAHIIEDQSSFWLLKLHEKVLNNEHLLTLNSTPVDDDHHHQPVEEEVCAGVSMPLMMLSSVVSPVTPALDHHFLDLEEQPASAQPVSANGEVLVCYAAATEKILQKVNKLHNNAPFYLMDPVGPMPSRKQAAIARIAAGLAATPRLSCTTPAILACGNAAGSGLEAIPEEDLGDAATAMLPGSILKLINTTTTIGGGMGLLDSFVSLKHKDLPQDNQSTEEMDGGVKTPASSQPSDPSDQPTSARRININKPKRANNDSERNGSKDAAAKVTKTAAVVMRKETENLETANPKNHAQNKNNNSGPTANKKNVKLAPKDTAPGKETATATGANLKETAWGNTKETATKSANWKETATATVANLKDTETAIAGPPKEGGGGGVGGGEQATVQATVLNNNNKKKGPLKIAETWAAVGISQDVATQKFMMDDVSNADLSRRIRFKKNHMSTATTSISPIVGSCATSALFVDKKMEHDLSDMDAIYNSVFFTCVESDLTMEKIPKGPYRQKCTSSSKGSSYRYSMPEKSDEYHFALGMMWAQHRDDAALLHRLKLAAFRNVRGVDRTKLDLPSSVTQSLIDFLPFIDTPMDLVVNQKSGSEGNTVYDLEMKSEDGGQLISMELMLNSRFSAKTGDSDEKKKKGFEILNVAHEGKNVFSSQGLADIWTEEKEHEVLKMFLNFGDDQLRSRFVVLTRMLRNWLGKRRGVFVPIEKVSFVYDKRRPVDSARIEIKDFLGGARLRGSKQDYDGNLERSIRVLEQRLKATLAQ